ncbi:ATP-binding protein [Alcanivorax sp. 1008]|uniref:ATP-binding protein n=1 Tax=Alcanivorax sp. 1008 TaxID=2816853 RepID=UPI001D481B3D|nr:ATP-binding protein [Alcanivorax sp. 1008]MCC1497802.1 ATP-binding protein [Alcanivorax sp. 1008]
MVCSRLLVVIMMFWLGTASVWAEDRAIEGGTDNTTPAPAAVSHDVQHRHYWRQTSLLQYVNDKAASDNLPDTLQLEYGLARRALADIYERWQARLDDDSEGLSRYRDLISTILILALAIGAFAGLHKLAKRSTATLLNIHNLIIARAPKQRWVKALARPFSGIAPLAPWILLWLVLTAFTSFFSGSNAALLHWWAPLAELYIVYGLLSLSGEWLLLRISTGAGVFLGGEQNKQLANHARSHARWMIWPWIILYIIDHWIGPSLTYRVAELATWLVNWFAIASLLKVRRQDYLVNLKRLLSQRFDPIVERVLSPRGFIWSATLLLPLQILLFVLQYLDMLLSDFDWYRSLSARWFRMRTKVLVEQDGEEISSEEVPQQYERWFTPEGDGEMDFPVIDTGLMDAMRKPLDLWLDGRSDENALLVAGEKGIGKSAALARLEKFIRKERPDLIVHRLTIPAKTTSREAVYKLIGDLIGTDVSDGPSELARTDAERTPTIIMLDEAQNLFLAEVGHLDGWRGLLNLTNVRVENLFWIVSINNQSWAYLCNVFGREYQMRNAIRVKRWSQNEIRSLILSRNHLSGFKLQYDDILLTSRGPDAGNLRNAEQRFFSLLWDSCRGIPMTALEMWLTSIRPGERTVTVGLPQVPGSGVLEKLGPKLMFVYAAVVTHENLTFEEILKVTNQQENVVRYALKSALDAEFMQRSKEGRYRITPLWYNTVISYLNRKNMLHE